MSILYISDKSNSTVKINKLGSNTRNFRILKNRLSPESVELDRVFVTMQYNNSNGSADNNDKKPDLYIGK